MATIANLGVSLTARIGNFERGFKKAQRIAGRFGNDLARHTKTIAAYGAATVGVAAYATSRLVKQQMEAIDSTSKLSRTLGLATEDLVGYQHAATLAGVDSDKLATAILKVNKSTDAALAGMTTDERLLTIANQYQAITNAADRATYLTKLFGKAGLEMGALFEIGADGILQAKQEAQALGLTFSELDGRKVEEANDAFTRMQEAITGTANRIAIQLAPYIVVIADRLREVAMGWNTTGEAADNAIGWMENSLGNLLTIIDSIRAAWNSFMAGVLQGAALMARAVQFNPFSPRGVMMKIAEVITGEKREGPLDAIIKAWDQASMEAAERSNEAIGRIFSGENAAKARALFQGLQIEAGKVSAKIEAGIVPAVNAADTAAKAGEFRQVDLSRIAIGGPSGKGGAQKVEDPQLKTTNSLLRQIQVRIGNPLVTA